MINVLLWASTAAAALPIQTPVPQQACATVMNRAFDFWVGDWDVVTTGTATLVAHSKIENMYGGCAIRENWMPLKGNGGGSLSSFDAGDGRWHQRWVDSSGGAVDFDGGAITNGMALTGYWRNVNGPGRDALIRMEYSRNPDGSVRQHGLQSLDQGLSWTDSFDFTYRPHR